MKKLGEADKGSLAHSIATTSAATVGGPAIEDSVSKVEVSAIASTAIAVGALATNVSVAKYATDEQKRLGDRLAAILRAIIVFDFDDEDRTAEEYLQLKAQFKAGMYEHGYVTFTNVKDGGTFFDLVTEECGLKMRYCPMLIDEDDDDLLRLAEIYGCGILTYVE